ncbi:MAG TPA: zinc dependent phospholipase C family protein [Ktedonobacteraceae bacterium]|nr:zinc dependent phospholipase C family protein [Ktedonobacteraceae bacterium]
MPAFLTHWRILIETARQSQDAGSDLGSLIIDAAALRRRAHGWSTPPQTTAAGAVWDTGPLPEIDFPFPGSDISAMAFLGALAPDIMYYSRLFFRDKLSDRHLAQATLSPTTTGQKPQWSELFHCFHSGEILIAFLEQIALVPSPALRSQALAFALGYISHIATDIALNPWINALASQLPKRRSPGRHYFVELRLDEYLAQTYFDHPRYHLLHQPWGAYIEPVASELIQPDALVAQLLTLLAVAAEVYQLEDEQTEKLPEHFRRGLQGLRHFLAGRGRARWLTLRESRRKDTLDIVSQALANPQSDEPILALTKVLGYAEHLSTHLCRRALSYYTALRNPNAEASERSSQRIALVKDLRNWNLNTGYDTDTSEEHPLHNWAHFSKLWEQSEEEQNLRSQHILPAS